MYLLIPVVILANNFSSEKIITECEEIHHYNTELEEKIIVLEKECNTSISILDEQRERIKQEVAELERQRDTILLGNSDLAEIAEGYKKQRDEAINQRDSLQLVVDSLQLALYTTKGELQSETDRADLCEEQKSKLQEQYDLKTEEAKQCKTEKDGLQEQYDLKIEEAKQCKTEKDGLQEQYDRKVTEAEQCKIDLADLRKRLDDCENNASNTDYEVTFSQVLDTSPTFNEPAEHALFPSYKYEVIVNGKIVTSVCPGECAN
ncbi:MAG: hypothetical protein ACRBG0_07315 [Lewinella sp.]|uniref:hypothetical protein n=1 Tax=Lewinella sp. TaxID=2004506 RepID=UPI003D6A721C